LAMDRRPPSNSKYAYVTTKTQERNIIRYAFNVDKNDKQAVT